MQIFETNNAEQEGFTLVELAIVLVIIGLIIGGVLVGNDLIEQAEVKATIQQLNKYRTAVNTFHSKYGYLPGDIPDPTATNFGFVTENITGFTTRGRCGGDGDGNGLLQSNQHYSPGPCINVSGTYQGCGETVVFWRDLSTSNLIENKFSLAKIACGGGGPLPLSLSQLDDYFPQAKIGQGNYIFVWSGNGKNHFELSALTGVVNGSSLTSNSNIKVWQAFSIDNKIDDGLPQSGIVKAEYIYGSQLQGASGAGWNYPGASGTGATSASNTTCYDNGNVTGAQQKYSFSTNKGNGKNCALSFRF